MRSLVNPKLRAKLPEHWLSSCTIQSVTVTLSESGQKVPYAASNVAGLVNIQCRMAPIIDARPTDEEIRTTGLRLEHSKRILKLNGYFPQIVNRAMQAVVDGVTFEIRGVEADSQSFSTRLRLESIKI